MKSSRWQAENLISTGRKIMMTFAVASLLSGMAVTSAYADKDKDKNKDKDRDRGDQHDNGRHGEKHGYDGHRYYPEPKRHYSYVQPVYVPPPVYYEPRQSPGVTVFFPLDLRR